MDYHTHPIQGSFETALISWVNRVRTASGLQENTAPLQDRQECEAFLKKFCGGSEVLAQHIEAYYKTDWLQKEIQTEKNSKKLRLLKKELKGREKFLPWRDFLDGLEQQADLGLQELKAWRDAVGLSNSDDKSIQARLQQQKVVASFLRNMDNNDKNVRYESIAKQDSPTQDAELDTAMNSYLLYLDYEIFSCWEDHAFEGLDASSQKALEEYLHLFSGFTPEDWSTTLPITELSDLLINIEQQKNQQKKQSDRDMDRSYKDIYLNCRYRGARRFSRMIVQGSAIQNLFRQHSWLGQPMPKTIGLANFLSFEKDLSKLQKLLKIVEKNDYRIPCDLSALKLGIDFKNDLDLYFRKRDDSHRNDHTTLEKNPWHYQKCSFHDFEISYQYIMDRISTDDIDEIETFDKIQSTFVQIEKAFQLMEAQGGHPEVVRKIQSFLNALQEEYHAVQQGLHEFNGEILNLLVQKPIKRLHMFWNILQSKDQKHPERAWFDMIYKDAEKSYSDIQKLREFLEKETKAVRIEQELLGADSRSTTFEHIHSLQELLDLAEEALETGDDGKAKKYLDSQNRQLGEPAGENIVQKLLNASESVAQQLTQSRQEDQAAIDQKDILVRAKIAGRQWINSVMAASNEKWISWKKSRQPQAQFLIEARLAIINKIRESDFASKDFIKKQTEIREIVENFQKKSNLKDRHVRFFLKQIGLELLSEQINSNVFEPMESMKKDEEFQVAIRKELSRHDVMQDLPSLYHELSQHLQQSEDILSASTTHAKSHPKNPEKQHIQSSLQDVKTHLKEIVELQEAFQMNMNSVETALQQSIHAHARNDGKKKEHIIRELSSKVDDLTKELLLAHDRVQQLQLKYQKDINEMSQELETLAEELNQCHRVLQGHALSLTRERTQQSDLLEKVEHLNDKIQKINSHKKRLESQKSFADTVFEIIHKEIIQLERQKDDSVSSFERLSSLQSDFQRSFEALACEKFLNASQSTEDVLLHYETEQSAQVDSLVKEMNENLRYQLMEYPDLSLAGGIRSRQKDDASEPTVMQAVRDKNHIRQRLSELQKKGSSATQNATIREITALKKALHRNTQVIAKGILKAYLSSVTSNAQNLMDIESTIAVHDAKVHSKESQFLYTMLKQALTQTWSGYYKKTGATSNEQELWKKIVAQKEFEGESLEDVVAGLRASFGVKEKGYDQEDYTVFLEEVDRQVELGREFANQISENPEQGYYQLCPALEAIDLEVLADFDAQMNGFIQDYEAVAWSITTGQESAAQFEREFQYALKKWCDARRNLIDQMKERFSKDSTIQKTIENYIQETCPLNRTIVLQYSTIEIDHHSVKESEHHLNSRAYLLKRAGWYITRMLRALRHLILSEKQVYDVHVQNVREQKDQLQERLKMIQDKQKTGSIYQDTMHSRDDNQQYSGVSKEGLLVFRSQENRAAQVSPLSEEEEYALLNLNSPRSKQ